MDLNTRVDVNCGRKDGRTNGRKTRRLYRTLINKMRQKAYNTVWRAALSTVMRSYSINANLARIMEQLYDKATSAV